MAMDQAAAAINRPSPLPPIALREAIHERPATLGRPDRLLIPKPHYPIDTESFNGQVGKK